MHKYTKHIYTMHEYKKFVVSFLQKTGQALHPEFWILGIPAIFMMRRVLIVKNKRFWEVRQDHSISYKDSRIYDAV